MAEYVCPDCGLEKKGEELAGDCDRCGSPLLKAEGEEKTKDGLSSEELDDELDIDDLDDDLELADESDDDEEL